MPYFRACYNILMFARDRQWMRIVLLLVLLMLSFSPMLAAAEGVIPTIVPDNCRGDSNRGGCQSICDIAQLAQNILNAAIYLAVFLSAVLFAWAGFLYLTNVASSGQHSKAVDVFKNVAIGLVIILAGWLIIDTVMGTLVNKGHFGPWNKICMTILDLISQGSGLV